jgi:hypothetical protein
MGKHPEGQARPARLKRGEDVPGLLRSRSSPSAQNQPKLPHYCRHLRSLQVCAAIGIVEAWVLSASLALVLYADRVGNALCHYATTPAFAAAQALHESADRRVRIEAETDQSGPGQARFMPTM